MNPWKAKLFLDALDERIVPDATPIVTFADAHTSGAVVAAYDNGGSGSGVVTYADRHTSGAVVAAYDNGYTSGSWVSTYSSGAGGGQQQVQISSRDDIIESGKELVAKLNALSLKTLTISVDLDRNQKALEKALERKYDMTLTRAERLVAAFELNALRVKDRELTELLQDTVDAYHDAESTLRAYDTLYNSYRGYGIDFGPYNDLPEIYTEYLRPIDPKNIL